MHLKKLARESYFAKFAVNFHEFDLQCRQEDAKQWPKKKCFCVSALSCTTKDAKEVSHADLKLFKSTILEQTNFFRSKFSFARR